MTPYRLKECVDDFIDCYNIHASGCKHQLHVMRSDMKKRILTAMSKMKRYIEHGMQLVFRSDAYAGLLRETYYVWDWIDLSDVRGIIRLLKDSEMMESQIEATDGRRFIHELNELLRKSLGKVEDSAHSDLNDATTTGVWVLNFCDDIKGIISEKSAQWDDYISKYMERRGCDEYEACDELRTMAENSMVESDFYLKDSEKDLARLVRHIRSMQGNEEGENLDAFKLYFAQWEYLSKKMSKIGALAGFHQAIYRDCRSGAMVDIPEEDEKPVEAIDELHAIIKEEPLYEEIVRWAATCKKPKDIRLRVCKTLKDHGFRDFGMEFAKALLPHLRQYEGSREIKNLQRQLS
ncbi:MAG: hypothetical protein MJZ32_06110 [Bacteroidaceae bacterium]|nr:hypothetical protein [Bacteroidaceae bacterium]